MAEKDVLPAEIVNVFDALPPNVAHILRDARLAIIRAAQTTPGVGQLTETLKWGEPAYLTVAPKSGTILRLGQIGGRAAIMVPCSTTIIEDARGLFGDVPDLSGTRGLILGGDTQLRDHVIHAGLTYYIRKRQ